MATPATKSGIAAPVLDILRLGLASAVSVEFLIDRVRVSSNGVSSVPPFVRREIKNLEAMVSVADAT